MLSHVCHEVSENLAVTVISKSSLPTRTVFFQRRQENYPRATNKIQVSGRPKRTSSRGNIAYLPGPQ